MIATPRHRWWSGTSAVEFALVAPVVLILLTGIIETGRLFWIQNTLQYATEEAARWAMVNQAAGEAEMVAYAQSKLTGLNPAGVAVTASPETVDGTSYVTIQATYQFSYAISLLPGGSLTLTGSTRVPLID
ncbi:MAG TPA: TadE/TadG family type IV pilus assembly protein [Azospirillaceae bacterium]|nr:TadE/TadG family type IV pilus assembly protein [Azospirillaceae bacterium]